MIAFESTCQSSLVLKLYVPIFASIFIDKVKKQLMKNLASYDLTENGAAKKRQTNSGLVISVVSLVTATAQ